MKSRHLNNLLNHAEEVLGFLKSRYPLFHLSNVFFRDIQYGIQAMLEQQNRRVGYREAENIAGAFIEHLVTKKILVPVDKQTWVLHYPEFRKPTVKPAAKPAAPAPPAPGSRTPSTGGAKPAPSLPGPAGAKHVRETPSTETAAKAESASHGTETSASEAV